MTHDDTTPGGLFRLLRRLLEDHQRMHPHHAHLCPLCQDTERTIALLAEEMPGADLSCPGCGAEPSEPHADTCPGRDGRCPGCAVLPGAAHLQYCPVGPGGSVFRFADIGHPAYQPR